MGQPAAKKEASDVDVDVNRIRNAAAGLRMMAEGQKRYYAFGNKCYPQMHAYLSQIEDALGIQAQPTWGMPAQVQ